jgi:hypothetical protein
MNLNDLAKILNNMHNHAPNGYKTTMLHLFEIIFAQDINLINTKALEIITFSNNNFNANISETYVTEIYKGKRLSDLLHIDNNKKQEIINRLNIAI